MISVFERDENIVGKGKKAGYQHFLLFPQCIQKTDSPFTNHSEEHSLYFPPNFVNLKVTQLLID